MVKVFTTNEKGKIEFTKKELEELLNEVWEDGYHSNTHKYWWYSPTITTATPYTITPTSTSGTTTLDAATTDSITSNKIVYTTERSNL